MIRMIAVTLAFVAAFSLVMAPVPASADCYVYYIDCWSAVWEVYTQCQTAYDESTCRNWFWYDRMICDTNFERCRGLWGSPGGPS